ncbi:MAG TPA: HYR domain-containing protein [Candidatus Polarisedimenticolaceae bacterium]|nr:HYR domain-containing protein [Candidatus Polarisedimenticolaceae bacterium]
MAIRGLDFGLIKCAAAGGLVMIGAISLAAAEDGPVCKLDAPSPMRGGSAAGQPIDFSPSARHFMEGEAPLGPVRAFAPGTDTSLCQSWEPTIAVDPNNPRTVAVAQFLTIQVSFDGGDNFNLTVTAPGTNPGGDPALAFDSQGRLFITYLCSPGAGRDVCISGYACDATNGTCTAIAGTQAVNVSVAAGIGGNNADKEWLAADWRTTSAFQDRLYVVWTRLDTNPWSIWTSWSSDQGQNWSAAQQISANDEGTVWPSHVAVGPAGAVYAAWHSQTGFLDPSGGDVPDGVTGQIVLRRSDNGGVLWQARAFPYPAGQADASFNVQHEANGVIPGANMWLFGSGQPWILPDPLNASRVFVVASDDPDNDVDNGDASDVFIATSGDSGATWGAPTRVDQGPPGTFQIMPTAAINPVNGAIGVSYYDNRALADADLDGIFELDLLATFSTDGGVTWSTEVDINDGTIDPANANTCRFCGSDAVSNQTCGTPACPAPGTTRIGEYNGLAYGECTLHAVWADDATCGGDYDTFYDRDPNLGGDTTAPAVTCPADMEAIECTGPDGAAVTYDVPEATDACDVAVDVVCTPPPGSTFPLGETEVTCTATDNAGNATACAFTVTVVDTTAPVLSEVTVSRPLLWPPNHRLVDEEVLYTVQDTCDPSPSCALSVASDEPINGTGDGDAAPDWIVLDAHHLQLRSERAGGGDGRTYTVTVSCEDDDENAAQDEVLVGVPHDQSGQAKAMAGFAGSGRSLIASESTLEIGLLSSTGVEPGAIDVRTIQAGNTAGVLDAIDYRRADVGCDGRTDLIVTFSADAVRDLQRLAKDVPVAIRYEDLDGNGFLVLDLFDLGDPEKEQICSQPVRREVRLLP